MEPTTTTKLIDENTVEITTTQRVARYVPRIVQMFSSQFYDSLMEEFHQNHPMTVFHRDYSNLTSFEFGDMDNDETYTLEDYQKALDEAYGEGEYEAFVLGAYIHSSTSFSITKTGDNRCKWDSSNLGFIGIPKSEIDKTRKLASELTDIWEGNFYDYIVYDNLEQAIADNVVTNSSHDNESVKALEQQFNVDFSNVDIDSEW